MRDDQELSAPQESQIALAFNALLYEERECVSFQKSEPAEPTRDRMLLEPH
jgi:hypothetical protein